MSVISALSAIVGVLGGSRALPKRTSGDLSVGFQHRGTGRVRKMWRRLPTSAPKYRVRNFATDSRQQRRAKAFRQAFAAVTEQYFFRFFKKNGDEATGNNLPRIARRNIARRWRERYL